MKYCSECGTALSEDALFCSECGTAQPPFPPPQAPQIATADLPSFGKSIRADSLRDAPPKSQPPMASARHNEGGTDWPKARPALDRLHSAPNPVNRWLIAVCALLTVAVAACVVCLYVLYRDKAVESGLQVRAQMSSPTLAEVAEASPSPSAHVARTDDPPAVPPNVTGQSPQPLAPSTDKAPAETSMPPVTSILTPADKEAQKARYIDPIFDQNGLIFADSDRRFLSEKEVRSLSQYESKLDLKAILAFAQNEILARCGQHFASEPFRSHYARYEWYTGMPTHGTVGDADLNAFERANCEMIGKAMEELP